MEFTHPYKLCKLNIHLDVQQWINNMHIKNEKKKKGIAKNSINMMYYNGAL